MALPNAKTKRRIGQIAWIIRTRQIDFAKFAAKHGVKAFRRENLPLKLWLAMFHPKDLQKLLSLLEQDRKPKPQESSK